MTRVVLLILAVLVFFWLLRRALGSRNAKRPSTDRPAGATPAEGQDSASAPELVACAQCGVLMPLGEALAGTSGTSADPGAAPPQARYFCCEEHRRLGSG